VPGRVRQYRLRNLHGKEGSERRPKEGGQTRSLLAPLAVGDELPWKLSREGHPQWLVVIEIIGTDRYVVEYPDGATQVLVDSA
jgi:hypothetical protein